MQQEISQWHHLTRADGLNPVELLEHPFDAALKEMEEEEEDDDWNDGDGLVSSEVYGDLCLSGVSGVVADVDDHRRLLPTAPDLHPPA